VSVGRELVEQIDVEDGEAVADTVDDAVYEERRQQHGQTPAAATCAPSPLLSSLFHVSSQQTPPEAQFCSLAIG